jgi:nucleoid-associated protein YgaU
MQKDLKTGLLLGLVLIAIAALWLSTRQGLSVKSRMMEHQFADAQMQFKTPDIPAVTNKTSIQLHTKIPASEQNSNTEQSPAPATPRFTMDLPDTGLNSSSFGIETKNQKTKNLATSDESGNNNGKTTPKKFHVVRRGETLSGISYKYYGSANKWQKIYDANRSRLKDANRLKPGIRLIIPQ